MCKVHEKLDAKGLKGCMAYECLGAVQKLVGENLSGTNLSRSLYLIHAQINTAKGDSNTKLPKSLTKPSNW